MAIEYAGGTNRNDSYTAITTRRQLIDSINTTLVAAGWTSTATKAFIRLRYTGQPANNDTVTLAGKVYTWQTVLTNVDGNVAIGASALVSYQNLAAAINLGAGAGTAYAAAMTVNASLECGTTFWEDSSTANPTATQLKVRAKTAGAAGRGIAVSESTTNMTIDEVGSATNFDGYYWDSAVTAEGLRIRVNGMDSGETANPPNNAIIRIIASDRNTVVRSNTEPGATDANTANFGFRLGLGNSAQWRVIANRYSFWVVVDGASANYTTFGAGVGKLQSFLAPVVISGASNATPISITTSTAHGFSTGQQVCIRNVLGNTAANGTWTITVTDATHFTLDTSVGNGVYTSGGVVALVTGGRVSEGLWCTGNTQGTVLGRTNLGTNGTVEYWVSVNGNNHYLNSTSDLGSLNLIALVPGNAANGISPLLHYDGSITVAEPFLMWGTSAGAAGRLILQMYDAVVARQSIAIDTTGTFDSHNWINLTNANAGSATVVEGSLLIVTP